jgi:hypothetical protein
MAKTLQRAAAASALTRRHGETADDWNEKDNHDGDRIFFFAAYDAGDMIGPNGQCVFFTSPCAGASILGSGHTGFMTTGAVQYRLDDMRRSPRCLPCLWFQYRRWASHRA